jgi:hypothetical protein
MYVFEPKRDEVKGDWKRLHKGDLRSLHFSLNIIGMIKPRRIKWARRVALMGERKGTNRTLVGKREGKRQLGRPRPRWADNIRMDFNHSTMQEKYENEPLGKYVHTNIPPTGPA